MKRKIASKGYLTDYGTKYTTKQAEKRLEREGFLKDGKLIVEYGSKKLEKGDYVITFEIHKVKGKYDSNRFNTPKTDEYEVVDFLPVCNVDHRKHKGGCGHACIKGLYLGQQGITKLLKHR